MERKFICIVCPNSCQLEVNYQDGEIIELKGALCKRGLEFVQSEIKNPQRVFTGSVRVCGGELPLVSVRSTGPVPKKYMKQLGELSHQIEVMAPVEINQVVCSNLLGEGIDLMATKNIRQNS